MKVRQVLACVLMSVAGACAIPPPTVTSAALDRCATSEAFVAFDFPGASSARCYIDGEREISVLVTPEHLPPINPSPWYAFRYEAEGGSGLTVNLRYSGATHRYAPIWSDGASSRNLPVQTSQGGYTATLVLPPGSATVSAQELIGGADNRQAMRRWAATTNSKVIQLGKSHGGRPVEGVRLGQVNAPRLVMLIGRQHPPEVTGAIAMEAFVDRIAELIARYPALGRRYQFMVIPLLNPDGVERGHWRANLGGTDLNRDWGVFSQPETQAVRNWLNALRPDVRLVLMLDFHSTSRNLVYTQGDEASEGHKRFLSAWLEGKEASFPGYPFSIEPRSGIAGSGTAKNWFHSTYAVPAYTYEVADDADRGAARAAAATLAGALPEALEVLAR